MDLNATLLGQMITFAIFVWFTMRVVWPLLNSQLEARKQTIADGLAAGEQGRKVLAGAQQESQQKINEARQQAAKIIAEADHQASMILEQAREQARKESADIVAAGHVAVDNALKKARKDLQSQVAEIAIMGAEKILQRSITPADHEQALRDLAKNLG